MKKLSMSFLALILTALSCSESPGTRTYTTSFPLQEDPISENGNWISGKDVGQDWCNIVTASGLAMGTNSFEWYSDPTAVLTGVWGADQAAEATVYSVNQTEEYWQEVELRLRSNISAHSITGYEIFFRCLKDNPRGYYAIVRWNGPRGDWTALGGRQGAQFGVTTGDVVKASIVGNEIKVYLNGVLLETVIDSTFPTGNPGIGFNFGCGETYRDFGFSKFTASEIPAPDR